MKAIAVSPGYARGKVFLLQNEIDLSEIPLRATDVPAEKAALQTAIAKSSADLQRLITQFKTSGQKDQAEIFEAHALMIEDPELLDASLQTIETEKITAPWAFQRTSEKFAQQLAALDDEYLKERAADVRDIAARVLKHLVNKNSDAGNSGPDLAHLPLGSILVAHDITPSQISLLDASQVGINIMGLITEMGGKTSHTAILARALEIPAVAGAREILLSVKNGTEILFDAFKGEIIIDPSAEQIQDFSRKQSQFEDERKSLLQFKDLKTETKDHRVIQLAANIGGIADLPSLAANGAEAVGLYRTEFVFLNHNRVPSQQEQFQIYREVFEKLNGKHCIIRTLDIGGDKELAGLSVEKEVNPFLGLRGVRLCLQEKVIFKDQLKAILRAAHDPQKNHSVGIMIPMISNIEEILETKALIAECQAEMKAEKIPFAEKYEFGVMIEVPSAAMMVDLIARHVDFVSIGTNDLTQYVCATDRLNDKVEKLYDPYNPGFLRTMFAILDAARKSNLHAGICGSLAHAELLVPLFVGMGVTELSMTSQHILSTRKLVRDLSYERCQKLVAEILNLETSAAIKSKLSEYSVS